MKFKIVRESSLAKWLSNTNRQRDGVVEKFNDSLECKWQRNARELSLGHISIFCALGRANNNITDILTDERFDHLDFSLKEDKAIIFRQYYKLGLVISESLTDFQDIIVKAKKLSTKKSRQLVSKMKKPESVDKMISYCNHIFKHKCKGVYKCDHHSTLCFDDLGRDCCMGNVLDIDNANPTKCEENIDTIIIPKMDEMIERVIQAYDKLDGLFESDNDIFVRLCDSYSDSKTAKKKQ